MNAENEKQEVPALEGRIDAFIRLATYLDQSPLFWGWLFMSLIGVSFFLGKDDKLGSDLCLILAGNVSSRIRSKK